MPDPAKRQAVYDDLYQILENNTGEIIDGELIVSLSPPRDGTLTLRPWRAWSCSRRITSAEAARVGWTIYVEPEIHFETNVIVPDLAGWKNERLTTPPGEHRFTVTPDWVCEILFPSSARIDCVKKMRIFAEHVVRTRASWTH